MATLRTFADLRAVFAPSIVPVIADDIEIGHVITHAQAQADAFDVSGRPLGTFASCADAESAVRAAMGGSGFGD